MNDKAFKWLQETLHYPSYLHLLKPPKRHSGDTNVLQHPLSHCKSGEHHAGDSPFDSDNHSSSLSSSSSSTSTTFDEPNHRQSRIYQPFLSSNPGGPQAQFTKTYGNQFCSSLRNISATLWANATDVREKYIHGKWHGGRGRAWTPPGLEVGEDGSGTADNTDFLEDNLNNSTYPEYGYYSYYNYDDYDQPDWLTSHLEELYEIMRSSQMETNMALTVFLAIVFLFGVTGNILVLAVFSRGAGQHQASTVFIKALAVTDLIICLVVLPGVLLKEWFIPYRWDALCQGWELIRCSTIPLSTLILASVAVDRYVKICCLDKAVQLSPATAKKILLVTATISVCLGIPPMLRMGVYQAGEGPASSKIYLGLCMGNDLLVSKETVDRYWQAMAAKFLLVLLVVMVMYGMVFRTVYKQSRRWGRCAVVRNNREQGCSNSGGGVGGKSSGKGWFNRAYDDGNDDVDNKKADDNDDENDGGDEGENDNDVDKNGRGNLCNGREERIIIGDVKNYQGKCAISSRKYTSNKARPTNMTTTIQSEEKKSSFSLSFLCGSKRNSDVVIEKAPSRLSVKHQDALHDDGVTSLDDGHMSYLNTPSTSSQQKLETKAKKRPLSAIFSCTSQLIVSRKAYTSKKSYYQSDADREDENEDIENGNSNSMATLRKGKIPLPQWLRRWKRLVTVALFTTVAQRDEEKKSALKLALRQKAKIKMMNQEVSCEIGDSAPISMKHPCDNAVSQLTDSPTDITVTTKLSSINPISTVVVETVETNLVTKKRDKLKKWSHSLDFVISNPEKNTTKTLARHTEINLESEQITHQEYTDRGIGQSMDNSTRLFTSYSSNNFEGKSAKAFPVVRNETGGSSGHTLVPENNNIITKSGEGPFWTWQNHQGDQHVLGVPDDFKQEKHIKVLNSISCPAPSKTITQLTKENCKNTSCNRVHPLNSPLFSYSDPNMRVTLKQGGQRDNKSDSHEVVETNKQWTFQQTDYCDCERPNTNQIPNACTTHCVGLNKGSSSNKDFMLLENSIDNVKSSLVNRNESGQIVDSPNMGQTNYNVRKMCHKLENIQGITAMENRNFGEASTEPSLPKNGAETKLYPKCEGGSQGGHDCEIQNHRHRYEKQSNKTQQLKYVNQKPKKEARKKHGGRNRKIVIAGKSGSETAGEGIRRAPHRRYNGAQVKTAQVLFLVTVIYVLSFAPVLLMSVEAVPPHPIPFYGYFIHSAANPILYSFINEAFRSQLYRLLCPNCCKKN